MQLKKNPDYVPQIFSAHQGRESKEFWLLNNRQELDFLDLFVNQKKELFKIRNPKSRLDAQQLEVMYQDWAAQRSVENEGTWVYYPWSNRMLRVLDEAEFVELRTSRNQHKITAMEQEELRKKTIGVIGLSVGNAVAVTLAIERIGGHIKLADFDELELSNLNRIRAGLHNLGLNKAIVTAREIAEIDPYLKVTCFTEGITADNIDAFIEGDHPIDLLIDECDDLEVKILARIKAKEYRLPLLMETSDRGMLDIERFDLDPELPIFHGMLSELPPQMLTNIPSEHKMGLVMRIIDAGQTSARGRASLLELGQTIGTWPQLASAVAMGGGVVGDISRKILLDQHRTSGRFYVDLDQILIDSASQQTNSSTSTPALSNSAPQMPFIEEQNKTGGVALSSVEIQDLTRGLVGLPEQSTGLHHHWYWDGTSLHLLIDPGSNNTFVHFHNLPSKILLGLTMCGLRNNAVKKGLVIKTVYNTENEQGHIHQTFAFEKDETIGNLDESSSAHLVYFQKHLASLLQQNIADLDEHQIELNEEALKTTWILEEKARSAMDRALGRMRALMILNKHGHSDFYARATITKETSLPIFPGFDFDQKALTAFAMLADYKSAAVLRAIDGGALFAQIFTSAYQCGLAYLQIELPHDPIKLGELLSDLFQAASELGLSAEPMCFPAALSGRLGIVPEGFSPLERERLIKIQKQFCQESAIDLSFDESLLIRISLVDKAGQGQRQLQKLNYVIDTINPTHE